MMAGIRIRKHLLSRGGSHLKKSSQRQAQGKALNSSRGHRHQANHSLKKDRHSCVGIDRLDPQTSLVGIKLLQRQGHSRKASFKESLNKVNLRDRHSKARPSRELNNRLGRVELNQVLQKHHHNSRAPLKLPSRAHLKGDNNSKAFGLHSINRPRTSLAHNHETRRDLVRPACAEQGLHHRKQPKLALRRQQQLSPFAQSAT
ncbi:hypothetical protein EYF80_003665 [Liparis tanakae]|uniref:Uncharacterized protein n=1 Tax=Liparis tanakae TaxID=230148 RepID=A0A4Z2J988_9TELE|nr:hypothetical protein EYF80_003665 [Liparis tanakae]